MRINPFKHLAFYSLVFFTLGVQAQGSSGQNFIRSPYSNYGIGEWTYTNPIQSSTAQHTFAGHFSYTLSNPATLGNVRYTVFDFAGNFRNGTTQLNDKYNDFNGGGISYMSLALPIWKKVTQKLISEDSLTGRKTWQFTPYGASSTITLKPMSTMGYEYHLDDEGVLPGRTTYTGSGGVNLLQWNTGFRIGNWVNLGYGLGYAFGSTRDNAFYSIIDSFQLGAIDDAQDLKIRGMQQQVGALFEFKLDSTYHKIGGSYEWFPNMRATRNRVTRSMQVIGSTVRTLDTILNENSVEESFDLPTSFGVGYSVRYRRSLMLALDWRRQTWSNGFKAFWEKNSDYRDRNDYSASLFINPVDRKAPNEKKMKIPVRLSYGYGESNVQVTQGQNTFALQEHRVGIGFGIPIIRRYFDNSVLTNMVHVDFQYINRSLSPTLPKENFFTVSLGIQMGDIWFAKRKYD